MNLPDALIEELIDGLDLEEGSRQYDLALDAAAITARHYGVKPSRVECVRCDKGDPHTWHRSG